MEYASPDAVRCGAPSPLPRILGVCSTKAEKGNPGDIILSNRSQVLQVYSRSISLWQS